MKWLPFEALLLGLMLPIISAAANNPPTLENSVDSLTIEAKIGRGGDFLGFGFDSLWMMSGLRLARVDAGDNSVTDIPIEGTRGPYRGIGIGEGAVWVPDSGTQTIYKVDPSANKVVKEISADFYGSEGSIGVGEGAIWVITQEEGDRTLTRFNAASGEVQAKILLPSSGAGVVVDYGWVWVTGIGQHELYQIDPKNNSVVSIIPLHQSPRFIASGEDSIWVLTQDGTVQRIDSQTGKVTATIETERAGGGGDVATGGGYVWVSMRGMPVAQIDPTNDTLIRKFMGFGMGDAIRFGAGSLWVSGSFIHRIQPPN